MNKQKICIIGGGLTGLITAATLMKLDLEIDLITENIDQIIKTNRTTAISQDNYNNLRKLKLFNNIEKDFWPCSKMRLYTDNKEAKFNQVFELINDKNQNKKILYMIKNSVILEHLIKKLKINKQVKFKSQKKVSEIVSSGLLKSVKFKNIDHSKYNLVIVCTGYNSNLLNNFFRNTVFKKRYNEIAITTILKHDFLKNNIARQIFLNNEILALLPISNTKTSIVWSIKKSLFNKYVYKKGLFLKKKIKFYTKDFLKKIKFISKIEFKDLNLIIRKKYYKDRVLLFGDALHVIHPLAGQGFNMTLRDLTSLEKILKEKISLGLDIGSSDILSEFSNEAKPRNFMYSMGVDVLKSSFSSQNQPYKEFRNKILTNLNKSIIAKDFFLNLADKGFRF